jgi:CheY-like chemotaxis protein
MKILLFEDSPSVAQLIEEIGKKFNYNIQSFASALKAQEKYRDVEPDLVLMDIRMTGIDGVEAMTRIKALDPDAVVIGMTGISEKEEKKNLLNKGFDDFLSKPFVVDEFIEVLEKWQKKLHP